MENRKNPSTGKRKVKTGCRTCKLRKVKCDEGRPACRRCVSTGRVCDGYGIWGGGGNSYLSRQSPPDANECVVDIVPRGPIIIGADDKGYFEWFKCRSAIKLPGTFRQADFWTKLLFQASFSEPAVLHAVLALSAVNQRNTVNVDSHRKVDNVPDEQERFALLNYSKAIKAMSRLQPQFSNKDRASFRVALITCFVFVCTDFLRGHFETGQLHLQNGLNILSEMQMLSEEHGTVRLRPKRDSTDNWILAAFSRLHLQVELFKYNYEHHWPFREKILLDVPTLEFHNLAEAWQGLEVLLNGIFQLTHEARRQAASGSTSLDESFQLLESQQSLQKSSAKWLATWEAFESSLGPLSEDYEKAHLILRVYYTMSTIMLETCLHPEDESIFDDHTDKFVLLIKQAAILRISVSSTAFVSKALSNHLMDMSRSVVDMGWMPPLYFTATKCRVHRIRLQAIKLLETTSHREGIWDARITSIVARKVMELEERYFYKGMCMMVDEEFPLDSLPRPWDLRFPTLPLEYRLREVESVLEGSPVDKVLLYCKRREDEVHRRVLLSEYSVHLQRWTNRSVIQV